MLMPDALLDPELAAIVGTAIRLGDLAELRRQLEAHPGLAAARIGPRSLLHVATDWPGHFPNVTSTITTLLAAGATVDARFVGLHRETPLHWAASSDDVAALDALLNAGADIEAEGAGGTPLADAVRFAQWQAARRLVERGARPNLWQAAALGSMAPLRDALDAADPPSARDVTNAFWCACHGGQREAAELLLDRGADINWIGHEHLTPLDTARRSDAGTLVTWLVSRGARSAEAQPPAT